MGGGKKIFLSKGLINVVLSILLETGDRASTSDCNYRVGSCPS